MSDNSKSGILSLTVFCSRSLYSLSIVCFKLEKNVCSLAISQSFFFSSNSISNSKKNSSQASPVKLYRSAPKGKIPSRQKSPPLVPLGLHGLFVGFRTIHPPVVFFCRTFCRIAKKTFALQPPPPCCTCARKKQPKAIIHNL